MKLNIGKTLLAGLALGFLGIVGPQPVMAESDSRLSYTYIRTVSGDPLVRVLEPTVVVDRPVMVERVVDRPVMVERVVERPVMVERVVERPVMVERVVEKPQIIEKVVEKPVIVERTVERPVVIERRVERPLVIEDTIIDDRPLVHLGILGLFHCDLF